jgi:hypothetical protein
MLGTDTSGSAVGTAEDDWAWYISARHVISLSSRVDDLINGLHGEVEGHELASVSQTA